MTFSSRVRRRWIVSIVFAVAGFFALEILVWTMLAFVVFVALQIEPASARRLLVVVVEFLVGVGYILAWSVRGMQSASLDVLLRDAGPLEREVIKARIEEEQS